MRFLAVVAIVVPIIAVGYILSHHPRPETPSQVAARQAVDSLTRMRLEDLERGDVAAWAAKLRPDGLVIAADPGRARVGPAAATAAMQNDFAGGATLDIQPRVATGATRRGRLAWLAAPVDYRRRTGDDSARVPLLHSVAWLRRADAWRVMVEHDARIADWEALRAGAVARRFAAPAHLVAPQGRRAQRLGRRFERWLPAFSGRRVDGEAIAVGPTGAVAVGDSAVQAMLAGWVERLGTPRIAAGGLTAWAPRDRGVGWTAANLEVTPPGWGGATLPLRYTCVYRESGGDSWRLVLAHLSVAVPEVRGSIADALP